MSLQILGPMREIEKFADPHRPGLVHNFRPVTAGTGRDKPGGAARASGLYKVKMWHVYKYVLSITMTFVLITYLKKN